MYTFTKEKNSLVISVDGVPTYSISIGTLGREEKAGAVEVTDGVRIFLSINPSQVSGATTTDDILTAINTALT